MSAITIVIADSVDSCRDALQGFILENRPDYQLLHTASQAQEVLYTAKQYQPNLVIIDVDLPGMCSLQLCQEVFQHCPGTRIITRTTQDTAYHARRMLKAGALGILSKNACKAELRQCLHWVHEGNLYLPRECHHLHIGKFRNEEELGEFELKVLSKICLTKTLEQIPKELYTSLSRVRRAKETIKRLANTSDSIGIMRWACLQGYVSLKESWGL